MKRKVLQAIRHAESVQSAVEAVETHLRDHVRWDSAAYATLAQHVGEVAESIQTLSVPDLPAGDSPSPVSPFAPLAELINRVRDHLQKHVAEDVKDHGTLLGDVAHLKTMVTDLVSRYYALLDVVENDKDKEKK